MDKLLKDILREQMQIKGLNFERLRQLTGITDRYLNAFVEGRKERLPSAPYARGYLMKLASALDLNGQELWDNYKQEILEKSSGPNDRLPENRYALKKINKKWAAFAGIGILLVIYLVLNVNRFLGRPDLKVASPGPETIVTTASTIELLGTAEPGIKLTVGGEEVFVDAKGGFQKTYTLEPGLNRIEFKVKGILGKEAKVVKQVIYQPPE